MGIAWGLGVAAHEVAATTTQTAAEKYAWLNHVQCVGKLVEVKGGPGGFVKYDIFVVR